MGWLSKLNPKNIVKNTNPKNITKNFSNTARSAINLAKNPTDMNAIQQFGKDSLISTFLPATSMRDAAGNPILPSAAGGNDAQASTMYTPLQYSAPPQYQSFASLFNQPQFDYSQVRDVYQRGAMPNNLLNRYNSMMQNLQAQQAAMVPRPQPTQPAQPQQFNQSTQPYGVGFPNNPGGGYVNFAKLFGGR